MATWKKQYTVTAAGLNIAIGTVQEFVFRCLSITGPYMAVGDAIDGTAGTFLVDFKALDPAKLPGTGERSGDLGESRLVPVIGAVNRVAAFRVPAGAPDAIIEVQSATPF